MKRKRRTFSAEFKLKVILAALQERETLSELAQKYDLHPNQISKWKTDFLDRASSKSQRNRSTFFVPSLVLAKKSVAVADLI